MLASIPLDAFDYQMEGGQQEEPATSESEASPPTEQSGEQEADASSPQKKKATKKKRQKKSKKHSKPKSKAAKKARKIKKEAKKKAVRTTHHHPPTGVQDQIRLLNARIDQLEMGHQATPISSMSMVSDTGKSGGTHVSGSSTNFKIGGYVKVDAIYDVNQCTGDSSNLPTLRLRGLDADAARQNTLTAHAKQTRINLGTESHTQHGQVMTYFEGDFFGTQTNGSAIGGSFSRADTSSTNSYNFRIRHAYGSYCYNNKHRIDIGQMWTLFYDIRSGGTTIEFNGPETTAQIRRPQIRYTYMHNKSWRFSASAESGATEYIDISPAYVGSVANGLTAGSPSNSYNSSQYRRAQNSFLGGITGDGNQSMPDFVGQAIYEKSSKCHVSIAGMMRQLIIKKVTTTGRNDPVFKAKKYGYGLALGGRWFFRGKSNIFGQFNFGKGIGTYIFALDGYGALVDASRSIMRTQSAYGGLIGLEFYWHEKWRSNFIFSQACAFIPAAAPAGKVPVIGLDAAGNPTSISNTGYSISRLLRQIYVNLLWEPVDKFELGIEYAYFRRNTINEYFGFGNRFQFGAYYKF